MGPPEEQRVNKDTAQKIFAETGFGLIDDFDLGENYYCLVFQLNSQAQTGGL